MPYIKKELRTELETRIADNAGELNYLISSYIDEYINKKGFSYSIVNEIIGALECAKLELYRRLASPYEDKKIIENGEVYFHSIKHL
jgi:uncharacterized protein YpmS